MEDRPKLSQDEFAVCHAVDYGRHYRRLLSFMLIYGSCGYGAFLVQRVAGWPPAAAWALSLPLYLLAAAALHGISLFAHEAVHQTLAENKTWNRVLGAACAIPVLQNCSAYRVLHLRHHGALGEEGDPDHYANYTRWTWMVFIMNWLRLIIGYPVYITAIPLLGFKNGSGKDRTLIVLEVLAAGLVIAGVWMSGIPRDALIHGWLLPMLFINFMVNIRGMSQHTLLVDAADEIKGTRTILTSRLVAYFMCNENYHLEHHLYPAARGIICRKFMRRCRRNFANMGRPIFLRTRAL
ncbi:MAG: fatty acid desaturase [Rhodothermales bacterium]|jgi:fatty acid desaturase